jgi:diguanylate cyclase (GGDEF)-like protein
MTPSPTLSPTAERTVKYAVIAAATAAYVVGFPFLTQHIGNTVAVVSFAIVMGSAWLCGTRAGVVLAILTTAANTLLYWQFIGMAPTVGNVVVPLMVALGLGGLIGYLRDLRRELEHQNAAIQAQADRDVLTGLLNRSSLDRQLASLLELSDADADVIGVMFVDLDRFKAINDTLGHEAGDELLKSVAGRLTEHTRGGDLVGRLGGDEFVAVLKGIEGPEDAMTVAQHVLGALNEPHAVGTESVRMRASIGISFFPQDGRTVEELIGRADNAMYRVKWQGKNGVRFFGEGGREEVQRMRLRRDLGAALEGDAFTLVYQPIVDLDTGRTAALEALLRWHHAELGAVPPTTIVELAEELGLTGTLGRWVLASACRDAAAWTATDGTGEPPRVSVNISPSHAAQPGFAEDVLTALHGAGLAPEHLEIELTEEALLGHRDAALGHLARLRSLGVRIAIDDFGVGYSSLAYLREIPADVLKLDRVFIQALDTLPLDGAYDVVAAVVSLGHALGKTVVAEGVETCGQLDSIRRIGCDQAQGYLIARPAPLDALQLPRPDELAASGTLPLRLSA